MANHPKLNLKDLAIGYPQSQKVFDFILFDRDSPADYKLVEDTDVVDLIREGIPKRAINNILEKTGISKIQLSQILHISTRQMDRYDTTDRLPAEQSNFLYEFSRIYTRGLDILGDAITMDGWLTRVNVVLGEKPPLDMMDTSEGIRMVDHLLSQIEYGFYS